MWSTRRVTRADEDAWVGLCTASEGPEDYVLDFLDHFLERAVTYVALDGERFIGTMTYAELLDGAAWLSAARTLPEYRGRGVASDLVRAFEELARSRARTALRLWTAAANEAGVATFRKNGLREVARFTRMAAEAGPRSPSRFVPVRTDEDLWSRVRLSEVLARSAGYVSYDYGFVKVGRDVLAALQRNQAILGFDAHVAVVSGSSEGYVEQALEVEPLTGDLAALLAEARVLAADRGKARVETFLPHDLALLEMARDAGFTNMEWGQQALLCEKPLGPAPSA